MKTLLNADIPTFTKFGKTVSPKEDPTRTRTLRARFVRQMRVRWRDVSRAVPRLLEEVAGLPPAQRVTQFISMLEGVERLTILERRPKRWTDNFIQAGFARGVMRGNLDLRRLARQKPVKQKKVQNALRLVVNIDVDIPTLSSDNVNASIVAGARAEVFELEATSTWQGLSGVTAQVNTQVAQVLAQAIASRATLAETAAAIRDRIDKIGVTRSELIARTEIVKSNNLGALSEYSIAESIIGESVYVQWVATLDSRVRPHHLARHGKVFTRDEYAALIGEPNCRCSGVPYVESVEGDITLSKASTFKDLKTGKPKGPTRQPVK